MHEDDADPNDVASAREELQRNGDAGDGTELLSLRRMNEEKLAEITKRAGLRQDVERCEGSIA